MGKYSDLSRHRLQQQLQQVSRYGLLRIQITHIMIRITQSSGSTDQDVNRTQTVVSDHSSEVDHDKQKTSYLLVSHNIHPRATKATHNMAYVLSL
ncbi:hypothetical protein E2C01_102512 [Portunus trituberculatus]|uniref:Uncharacterized protein n=1 Tax=Portunus trituberculatus TaxID=210409 RepID=A0A5B7KMS7_PORTR|nr:hypothetical protein [Portunus trituberculatus]